MCNGDWEKGAPQGKAAALHAFNAFGSRVGSGWWDGLLTVGCLLVFTAGELGERLGDDFGKFGQRTLLG